MHETKRTLLIVVALIALVLAWASAQGAADERHKFVNHELPQDVGFGAPSLTQAAGMWKSTINDPSCRGLSECGSKRCTHGFFALREPR